jgi:thiol-disulfide isomerase/thioredoxin
VLALFLSISLPLLVAAQEQGASERERERDRAVPMLDEPAVPFEAEDVNGNVVKLEALRGKVVLINFWGIWCKSCRLEIPHLVELDERLGDRGLVILGADYGDDPKDLPAYIDEMNISYPVLLDDGLADVYEVLVFPTSVLIDRSGRVRLRIEGYEEDKFRDLVRAVEELLSESDPVPDHGASQSDSKVLVLVPE